MLSVKQGDINYHFWVFGLTGSPIERLPDLGLNMKIKPRNIFPDNTWNHLIKRIISVR